MSGKNGAVRYSHTRTDTLIGADLRFEGNLTFTGVLLIQGDTLGDVSCALDSDGTVVVGKTGSVTGTIKAPHLVVGGRVHGPVHSSESIEIQQGACIAGDAFYRAIDIHAGGVIEGLLIPEVSMERDQPGHESRIRISEPPASNASGKPRADAMPDGRGLRDRLGVRSGLGGVVALLVAAAAIVLINRDPTSDALSTPPAADIAPNAGSSAKTAPEAQSAAPENTGLTGARNTIAGDAAPLVPNAEADTKALVLAPRLDQPEIDPEKVVTVQGVNPGKPTGVFLVIGKDPSVLYRKKHQDPGDGTRIDVAQGSTESISIAKNEIFRVAKGRDLTIFYQGKKVAPKIIESGVWMSFVPQPPGAANTKK